MSGSSSSREPAPFPRTAAFVCAAAAARGGAREAAVRSWAAFPEHRVLVLNTHSNRFCERVGREHKSNNVLFVVDFRIMARTLRGARAPGQGEVCVCVRGVVSRPLPQRLRKLTPPVLIALALGRGSTSAATIPSARISAGTCARSTRG